MRPEPREPRRAAPAAAVLAPLAALALAACGGDDGPTEPSPPSTGTLEVSASTTGDTLDPDGYAVTLDGGGARALEADGTVTLEDVEAGDHEMVLSAVQVNCTVAGGAMRTVTVTAGETASIDFDVACEAALFDRIVLHGEDGVDGDLIAMKPDGSGFTALRDGSGFDLFPSVSPDGTRLAFNDRSGADSEIAVVAVDGSGYTLLTDNEVFDGSVPSWSPDGTRLAFSSYRDGDSEIYVMDADGSNVVQLTDNEVFDAGPAWSPDGGSIAFASDLAGSRDIHVMAAGGGSPTRLTESSALERAPAWSPDGARIAFERSGDIYVMNADGTDVELLATVTGGSSWMPSWSPDGTRVVFASDPDGDDELFVVGADGTGLTKIASYPASDEVPGAWGTARAER